MLIILFCTIVIICILAQKRIIKKIFPADTVPLTLSYTAIIGIASFTAVAENGRCKNNGIYEQLPYEITEEVII